MNTSAHVNFLKVKIFQALHLKRDSGLKYFLSVMNTVTLKNTNKWKVAQQLGVGQAYFL